MCRKWRQALLAAATIAMAALTAPALCAAETEADAEITAEATADEAAADEATADEAAADGATADEAAAGAALSADSTFGIIGALPEEVSLLCEEMEDMTTVHQSDMDFYVGTLGGAQAVVVYCGDGKVNAAMCTELLIAGFDCDAVIFTGVAGSLSADVHLMDIVISTETMYDDFDESPIGYEVGQVPNLDVLRFTADDTLVAAAQQACESLDTDSEVFLGTIATGDTFVDSDELKTKIVDLTGALCAEMEGASVGHVCYRNDTPYVVIRTISDNADDEGGATFTELLSEAAANSARIVVEMLESLTA